MRVAVAQPRASTGDVAFNVDETLTLAREADERGVDLAVFPELNLSSYAVDDLFLQDAFLDAVEAGIGAAGGGKRRARHRAASSARRSGATAASTIALWSSRAATILGVVPKIFLPNYREYYEKRWFASRRRAGGAEGGDCRAGTCPSAPTCSSPREDLPDFIFHIEICEDYWAPQPPSTMGALAGALILTNLSASNITIGKADERKLLCASQASRCHAAYVFSAAGPGESTTDLAWDGQGSIYELGELLAETGRFDRSRSSPSPTSTCSGCGSSGCATAPSTTMPASPAIPETRFRTIWFDAPAGRSRTSASSGSSAASPTSRTGAEQLDQDCYEAFNIQVQGLVRRFQATSGQASGHRRLGRARFHPRPDRRRQGLRRARPAALDHPRLHHAGLRHRRADQGQCLGADERARHRPARRSTSARPRRRCSATWAIPSPAASRSTTSPSRMCRRGFAPTISSASPTSAAASSSAPATCREIALGWSTYGVGDQMSHYGVNAGVPKTLIQYLIRWAIKTGQFDDDDQPRAAGDPRHQDLARAGPRRRGERHAVDRGPDRPLRAARFLPVPHPAPRPAAVQGRLPRLAGLEGCGGRALAVRLSRGAEARI